MNLRKAFEGRYEPVTESGCWLWIGYINSGGYGRMFTRGNRGVLAHRYSYWMHKGEIPKGKYVCHTCDTPSCVNPNHLFIGTKADNNKDRHQKNRTVLPNQSGSNHSQSKLTEADVIDIRRLSKTVSTQELSRIYGVEYSGLRKIINRKAWRHVE